jgi:AdoMet-dependent heme synthase
MNFIINLKNHHNLYENLLKKIKQLRKIRINRLEIRLASDIKELPMLSRVVLDLCRIFDLESFLEIWVYNFPLCLIPVKARDHIIFDGNYKGEKMPACQSCQYFEICQGFPKGYFDKYGIKELILVKDLPIELMLEIESRCNFNCKFCFNKISFASQGRNIKKEFSTAYVKKIINVACKAGIKTFRFTGGEPLLRKDIFELIDYAKNKGFEVRLNTNGSLIDLRVAEKLANSVDNVLIPIDNWSNKKETKITGYQDALKKKITAIKLLKRKKIPIVRVGTVASKENIKNFNKIARLILSLPINEWEWYRPINQKSFNQQDLKLLVDKICYWQKKTSKIISIANALPFCAVKDKNKINSISSGALFDDGHNRMVVDPRGFVKPHYFLNKNIGEPLDVLTAWNRPFMKKMRNLEFLPKECFNCYFKFKCRGGSRYEAKKTFNSYYALDPLAQPKNLSKIN